MTDFQFGPGDRPGRGGAPSLEAILSATNGAVEEARALGVKVDTVNRQLIYANQARRRDNKLYLTLFVVVALFLVVSLYGNWQTSRVLSSTTRTGDQIASCVDPAGDCYRQSREQGNAYVQALNKAAIYMAECARLRPGVAGPEFDAFLEQCVAERLNRQARGSASPAPSPNPSGG